MGNRHIKLKGVNTVIRTYRLDTY